MAYSRSSLASSAAISAMGRQRAPGHVGERAVRHRRMLCFDRILHECLTAMQHDVQEPGLPIGVQVGQQYADDARPIDPGCRAEQRVNRRA